MLVGVCPTRSSSECYADLRATLLTALTDPEGNITTFEYSAGHLSAVIDPMGNRTSVERDTWGNVISMTDAAEAKTHYEYDELRAARRYH